MSARDMLVSTRGFHQWKDSIDMRAQFAAIRELCQFSHRRAVRFNEDIRRRRVWRRSGHAASRFRL